MRVTVPRDTFHGEAFRRASLTHDLHMLWRRLAGSTAPGRAW